MNLTVADGFKFGCGFILALAFGVVALVLLLSLALFFSSLAGIRLPIPGA
jgi:hypothetical protein